MAETASATASVNSFALAARALGLAQQHEPAIGHHGQRADGVQQSRGPRVLAVEAIEVEVLGPAGENRFPQRRQRFVPQQGLLADDQVGGSNRTRRQLLAKLREVHWGTASKRLS